MTLLRGGFRRTPETFEEFFDHYLSGITPAEWSVLAQLPRITQWTELVTVISWIRTAPNYPLPPDHPLNPASRFEVSA